MYDNEYNRDIARRLRSIDVNYINSELSGRGACCCDGEANYKKGGARLGNPQLIGYPKGTYLQGSQMPSGAYGTNAYGMLGRGQVAVVSLPNNTLERQNTDMVGSKSAGLSRRLMQRYNGAGTVLPVIQSTTPYQSAIRHQVYDVNRPTVQLTPVAQLQGQFGGGRFGSGLRSGGKYNGAGFWEDFADGFKKGFFGTFDVIKPVLPFLGAEGVALDQGIGALKRVTGNGRSGASRLRTGGRPRLSKAKKAEKKALEVCNRKSGAGVFDIYKDLKSTAEQALRTVKPAYENVIKPVYNIVAPVIRKELEEQLREAVRNAVSAKGRSAGSKLNKGGRPKLSKAKKADKMALKSCMSGGSTINLNITALTSDEELEQMATDDAHLARLISQRNRLRNTRDNASVLSMLEGNRINNQPRRQPPRAGGGRGKNARAEIVKGVMKDKGLSMIQASSYVKANNLY